jgi:hypothetical protein
LPTRLPDKSIPEPWRSLLGELDAAVETEVRLDCMGGFAVTLVYGFSRPTADLDVLEIAPREAASPCCNLARRAALCIRSTKSIWILLVWRTYPGPMKNGSPRSSRSPSSIFVFALSILRPGAVEVKAQHSTGSRPREIPGQNGSARSGSADQAISEGTALATRQSGA